MILVFSVILIFIGAILMFFNEKIIELFNEDGYFTHKQNKYRKIVAGLGLVILGIWGILEYFGITAFMGQYVK
ncbi:MAG: hypothetical protein KKF62_14070 [Bacteroidetes bacterium]|nr:hypothetical protein [Bacteroidota bacterium]MBU1114206.1 hypothetical protein [Bacteroidota bacterium]MBU1797015.1 hypothetical protein [Bacteroidota bacterium]